ncbi:MAG: hypothetical protein EON60_10245 [Alphaproteobacteria bacterium]|nr:MAG: hypothetical protein EON60_10245 [Alphaproteobacteria bacterium]
MPNTRTNLLQLADGVTPTMVTYDAALNMDMYNWGNMQPPQDGYIVRFYTRRKKDNFNVWLPPEHRNLLSPLTRTERRHLAKGEAIPFTWRAPFAIAMRISGHVVDADNKPIPKGWFLVIRYDADETTPLITAHHWVSMWKLFWPA